MARFSATQRLQVLQTPAVRGWSVKQTCEFYGISPASFYRWRARFDAGGLAELEERSRRPRSSPDRVDAEVESTIVQWRQDHGWGARRIRDQLLLDGRDAPAVSTTHAVLVRNGLVVPQTSAAAATIRFERSCPNDLWQLDATEWVLADDRTIYVMDIIDDHSRFLVASRAVAQLSEDNAWATLRQAIGSHGPPRQLLTDNASWLTGRPFNSVIDFERRCWRLQIETIHCAPYHPETLGKIERQHRTLKHWLRKRPEATTIAQLQSCSTPTDRTTTPAGRTRASMATSQPTATPRRPRHPLRDRPPQSR